MYANLRSCPSMENNTLNYILAHQDAVVNRKMKKFFKNLDFVQLAANNLFYDEL